MKSRDTIPIAKQVFADIAGRFPALHVVQNEDIPDELSVTFPEQPGLKQKVLLSLQNGDELQFEVGHFCLQRFPCTETSRVQSYVEAVTGYLSGRYRILEHYRGRHCVKAELQVPIDQGWKTVGTWSMLWLPIPWTKSFKEVRNA